MRQLQQVITAQSTHDGDGVKIQRLAGRHLFQELNPFLMIDEIHSDNASDYIGGFPEHPHRGFETITYMKAGRMRHRDHMGNEGVIGPGDVQWMTAGAGVLHSEMPEQAQGLLHGFQIWLNLPATEKMQPAAYKDITHSAITSHTLHQGGQVNVVAGQVKVEQKNLQGPLPIRSTQPVFIDLQLNKHESVELAFNAGNTALVYVYQGATDLIAMCQLGIYSIGRTLKLQAGATGVNLLVLSGKDIQEPIVQYGPFVMNTIEEIDTAIKDFQNPEFVQALKKQIEQ